MGQQICCVTSNDYQLQEKPKNNAQKKKSFNHPSSYQGSTIKLPEVGDSNGKKSEDREEKQMEKSNNIKQNFEDNENEEEETSSQGRMREVFSKTPPMDKKNSQGKDQSINNLKGSLEKNSPFSQRNAFPSYHQNNQSFDKVSIIQEKPKIIKSEYNEKMDKFLFIRCQSGFISHFYSNKIKEVNQKLFQLIEEEIKIYMQQDNYISDSNNKLCGIFLAQDSKSPQLLKLIITANPSTAYAYGLYQFDIFIPDDYPNSLPRVRFQKPESIDEKEKLNFRIFPRVLEDGLVCLDMIGVFHGREKENNYQMMKKGIISDLIEEISQEIFCDDLMLQARIMEGESYILDQNHNESNINISSYGKGYENVIRFINQEAGIESVIQLSLQSKYEQEILPLIITHFQIVEYQIQKKVENWIEEQDSEEPLYSGIVSQHNPEVANILQKEGFEKVMRTKQKAIKLLFSKLKTKYNKIE